MNPLEKQIQSRILSFLKNQGSLLEDYTPGLCFRVYLKGRLKADLRMGLTYKYYDLASLTKIIFTVSKVMDLFKAKLKKKGPIDFRTPIYSLLPWWPKSNIFLKHLLTHTSGLPWWRPVYKEFPRGGSVFSSYKKNVSNLKLTCFSQKNFSVAREFLKKKLKGFKREPIGKCVYSDPGFWLLGFILEEVWQNSLMDIWSKSRWSSEIHFNAHQGVSFPRSFYAPTGFCQWRKKVLRGEVHDRNAWAFGGVAPHAGLFSSLEGLSKWALHLRKTYQSNDEKSFFIKKFTKRALLRSVGHWGFGFMKPENPLGGAGKFFSPSAFGHTGFSGSSFWFDPKRDLLVLILSNRTGESQNHGHSFNKVQKKKLLVQKKKNFFKNKESFKKNLNQVSSVQKGDEKEIDFYKTFETKRIHKMKKSPFSHLRGEIHNIVLKLIENESKKLK